MIKICHGCKLPFESRRDAKTCSAKCRKRISRLRQLANEVTQEIGEEIRKVEHSVADSLHALEDSQSGFVQVGEAMPVVSAPEPDVQDQAAQPISSPVESEPTQTYQPEVLSSEPPVSTYGATNQQMPAESLLESEISPELSASLDSTPFAFQNQFQSTPSQVTSQPKKRFDPALLKIAGTALLITLLIGFGTLFMARKSAEAPLAQNFPEQNLATTEGLDALASTIVPVGSELHVQGNGVFTGNLSTSGNLSFSQGNLAGNLTMEDLTEDRDYQLPDASGILCLDSNNCGFASLSQIADIEAQLGQIAVPVIPPATTLNGLGGAITLQGTTNRISVSTSNGVITLNLPQDIATGSAPTFGGLTLNGSLTLSLDCTTYLNGGTLTTNAFGQVVCADDDAAGGSGVTTAGGTIGTLPVFTAADQIGDSIISQALGTITVAGDLTVTGMIAADSLSLTTPLGVASGGTGIDASVAANGHLLIGNGAGFSLAPISQGNGITVTNGAGSITVAATLGTDIDSAEIVDSSILETDLSSTNAPTDNYILTYDQASGGFTWVSPGSVGGPTVDSLNSLVGDLVLLGTAGQIDINDNGLDNITLSLDSSVSLLGQTIGNGEIEADAVQLGTQTTGNYVASITAGNGISGSSVTEGGTPVLALGQLTADWNQTGAFDIILNNSSSEIVMMESAGNTFYGMLDVGDLSSNQTFTFLQGGTVITTGNIASNAVTSVVAGNGLITGGGPGAVTLDIGAGNGITVNANDIAVIYGSTANTAVQGDTSLTCASGTGNLSGGGNSITLGSGGTCDDLDTVADPTFATSVTTPSLILTGAGFSGTFQVANLGQATVFTLPDPGVAAADICLSTGNCAGSGGGITGAGTSGTLAVFTGSGSIGDSVLSQSGGNLTASGSIRISGGLASLGVANTTTGLLRIFNAGSANAGTLEVASLGQDTTFNLSDPGQASVDICLSTGNCVGGGSGGAPNSAAYLTIGNDATLTSERAIALNATNLQATDGGANGSYTINTIQDIAASSSPTFTSLTLSGDLAVNGGDITSTGALNITPGGALAIGVTTQTSTLSGSTINIGTSGTTSTINIGTLFSASTLNINAGTGGINVLSGDNFSVTATQILIGGDVDITGTLAVSSLGAASTDTVICRNGSDQLATCNSTFLTSADLSGYVQLQGSTPGSAQTGHINVTGTIIGGTLSATNNIVAGGTGSFGGNLNVGGTIQAFTGAAGEIRTSPTFALSSPTSNMTVTSGGTAGATSNSGSLTLSTGQVFLSGNSGSITLQTGNTASGSVGNIAIDNGSGTTGTPTITLGATNARSITIGNGSGATPITINGGTGGINIGSNAVAKTVTIGSTTGASALNLQAGTGNIDIGTSASARSINIATGAAAQPIVIGNTTNGTSFDLRTGAGAAINIGRNNTGLTTVNIAGASGTASIVNIANPGFFSEAFVTIGSNSDTDNYVNIAAGATGGINLTGRSVITGSSSGVALTVNNSTSTGNILNLQDNGSNVFTVADGGAVTSGTINGQTISSSANFTGTLAVATLGTADTDTVVCRNGSNQLATCSSTFLTGSTVGNTAFIQGGNSFGAQAILGTNDTNSLALETDGTTRWILGTDGHLIPNVDDTYDIGSDTARVRDLYLGPASLHIGVSGNDTSVSYNTGTNTLGLFNTTATTVDAFGAATNINVGSSSGFNLTPGGNVTVPLAHNKGLTVTSSLTGGSRSTHLLTLSQANNVTFNNSASLLRVENLDTGSSGDLISINQTSLNGAAIAITSSATSSAGVSVNGTSAYSFYTNAAGSWGYYAPGVTTGRGTVVGGQITTGSAHEVLWSNASNTSGSAFKVSGSATSVTSSYTGSILDIAPTRTISSGTVTDSGSFLNLTRANTRSGGTYNLTGDLAILQSNCTSCSTDTGNILELVQQNASSTGAVFNVSGAGTGNLATFDTTNASANGVDIDVQSSSASQYALRVRTNNGSGAGLTVLGSGRIQAGTTPGSTGYINVSSNSSSIPTIHLNTNASADLIQLAGNTWAGISFLHGSSTNAGASALEVSGAHSGALSSYTGEWLHIHPTRTLTSGSVTDTGNYLNLDRSVTVSNISGSSTYTLTGDVAVFKSLCTEQWSDTCVDTSNILELDQQFSGASGAVLNILNSGTGNAILLNSGASIASAAGVNLSLQSGTTGTLTLDTGTTGAINIGTNSNAKVIAIGNNTGATSVALSSGTGGLSLESTGTIGIALNSTAQTIDIGYLGGDAKTVRIGNIVGASSLTLAAGTGAINIGTTNSARTTNIATGAAAQTVTLGSTNGASSLTLNAGTGAINIGTSASARQVNIATGAASQAVAIATGLAAQSVTIGSFASTSAMALYSGTGGTLIFANGAMDIYGQTTTIQGVNGLVVNNATGTSNILELQDNGSNVLTVEDGGFVGIGVADPDTRLHVLDAIRVQRSASSNSIYLDASDANENKITSTTSSLLSLNGAQIGLFNDVYVGNAVTSATPTGYTLQSTGGSGTDIAGANFTLAGGRGTGTGVGGNIVFQYAPAGATGTSLNALQTACQISGTNGSFSCAGGSLSEKFGAGSSATGGSSLAVGNSASANVSRSVSIGETSTTSGNDAVAVGRASSASISSVAIGSSSVSGNYNIAIGAGAAANGGSGSIGIGLSASASHSSSITLGAYSTSTAANQFVVGSSNNAVTHGYFGNGVTAASPSGFTLQATGGSGTDIAGANFTIAGGRGTGSASGGDILFQTSDAGASGTTLRNLSTKMTIKAGGSVGIGTTDPQSYLHIVGNGDILRLQGTDHAYIELYPDGAGGREGYLGFGSSGTDDLHITNESATGSLLLQSNSITRLSVEADGDIAMDTNTLFVDAANDRVGIGTTSPDYNFDLERSYDGTIVGRIANTRSGGQDRAALFLGTWNQPTHFQLIANNSTGGGDSGTLGGASSVNFNNTADGDITFLTNNTMRLVLDNSNNAYFGNGVTAASPSGYALNATGGSGTDIAGANFTLAGGRGTGAGAGGSILFQTAAAGASGTSLNSLSTRMEIQTDGDIAMDTDTLFVDAVNNRVGIGTATPGLALHVNSASDTDILRLQDSDGTCDYNPEAGSVTVSCSSDASLKSNIVDASSSALDMLNQFRIRDYTVNASGQQMTGVIAQEVQQVMPDRVTMGSDGKLMVTMPSTWELVKGIQELSVGVSTNTDGLVSLSSQNSTQETSIMNLGSRVQSIESDLAALQSQLSSGQLTNLNVSGQATLAKITVTGSVTIGGTLTVQTAAIAGNLTIGGQIISRGDKPTVQALVAAGGSGVVEVEGTDTAGTLTIRTSASQTLTEGEVLGLSFSKTFGASPRVVLSPVNEAAVNLPVYVIKTANGFKVVITEAAQNGTEYKFDYFVIGSESAAN